MTLYGMEQEIRRRNKKIAQNCTNTQKESFLNPGAHVGKRRFGSHSIKDKSALGSLPEHSGAEQPRIGT